MLYRGYKQTFMLLKIYAEMVKKTQKKTILFGQNVKFWPFWGYATSGVQNVV